MLLPVGQRINLLEKRFETMINKLRKCLESDSSKVECFYEDRMYYLPQPLRGLADHLTCKGLEDGNFEEFFKLNQNLWNFIDFGLIRHLIRRCGTPNLKNEMFEYEKEVDTFCKLITVHQLIQAWDPRFFDEDIPEHFIFCVSKMTWDPYKVRVQDLLKIRRRIKEIIPQEIGKAAFVLVNVLSNCVSAVWLVLANIRPQLMSGVRDLIQSSPEFVLTHQLALFLLDDFILYPCTNVEKVKETMGV